MKYLFILLVTVLSLSSHAQQQYDSVTIRIRTILKQTNRPYNLFMLPGDNKRSDSAVMINLFFSKDTIINEIAYLNNYCGSLAAKLYREGLKQRAKSYAYITFWCRYPNMITPVSFFYAIQEPPKRFEKPEFFFYIDDILKKY